MSAKTKRSKRRRKSRRRRPINVLASALTAMGLYCGVSGIFAGINQNYENAAWYILAAIVFDIFDGTVAKITNSCSEFGKQLDSHADMVSFGVAPAVLIYNAYLAKEHAPPTALGRTGSMLAVVYVLCAWLRLARFNVYQSDMRDSFVGLPSPAAAGMVATFVLFVEYFDMKVAYWVLFPLTVVLAYLMVSSVRYPKDRLKAFVLAPKSAFRMLALCAVVIAVFHYAKAHSPAIVLFPLGAVYVLFGIGETLFYRFTNEQTDLSDGLDEITDQDSPPVSEPAASSSKTDEAL